MKYKLLVLDLDGTLTNQKKEVTEHTRRTLIEAQERGVKIVLASGRPTYGVAPLAEILELQKYEGYILSYNGGEIICFSGKYATEIPTDVRKDRFEQKLSER